MPRPIKYHYFPVWIFSEYLLFLYIWWTRRKMAWSALHGHLCGPMACTNIHTYIHKMFPLISCMIILSNIIQGCPKVGGGWRQEDLRDPYPRHFLRGGAEQDQQQPLRGHCGYKHYSTREEHGCLWQNSGTRRKKNKSLGIIVVFPRYACTMILMTCLKYLQRGRSYSYCSLR